MGNRTFFLQSMSLLLVIFVKDVQNLNSNGLVCNTNSDCQSGRCLCNTCRAPGYSIVPDLGKCTTSEQCQSDYCHGGSITHCHGQCQRRVTAGGDCSVGGNRQCLSDRCLCNTCRDKGDWQVPDGGKCTRHTQCQSEYCHGGSPSHCSGQCQRKLSNGGHCHTGGNIQCQSNRCLCNVCQASGDYQVPDGAVCQANTQCVSGWCEGGGTQHCDGRCRRRLNDDSDCTQWGNIQCQSNR